MTAKRETIFAAIEAALVAAAATFPGGAATVTRNDLVEIDAEAVLASASVILLDGPERVEEGGYNEVLRVSGFTVRIVQASADYTDLGPAISAAHAWSVQTIIPLYLGDGSLENIALYIAELGFDDPEYPEVDDTTPLVAVQIEFEATFSTSLTDPET